VSIEFGIFDHLDRGGFSTAELYANRLRLVEAYDQAGFRAYHLAEHHGTTLGMAPSPGIFLSAVAQRTRRLRFGPSVYVLPVHDPLRLIEEICMLDQLSGGRLELGIGRGFSPFEVGFFGVESAQSRELYLEAFQVLMQGLSVDVLDFEGKHFRYRDVPMVLKPVQRPHPPLWYGLVNVEGVPWAAANGVNVLTNGPAVRVRGLLEKYREEFEKAPAAVRARPPRLGVTRHVHVADTDDQAMATARQAYAVWYRSNAELWDRYKTETRIFPPTLEDALKAGTAIVGSPRTVIGRIRDDLGTSGADYLVSRLAFGDIPPERLLHCVELFASEIMPALGTAAA
jgi:alkanesulfonate monooxygenase SsuD/methylene tetrahydromethanopterin reductase-like flavin-dependent oxidoreductase (luciferase family)